ncbi:MAG: endopeptidase [Acidobacteriota bacterium]|jgi:Zn-dependent protease with chaperone function|nr:endopeptidase [Acidobacteriota bacterium]
MTRLTFSRRLFFLLVSLLLTTSSVIAAPGDDSNPDLQRKFAALNIKVDANGSALVFLGLSFNAPPASDLEQKLNQALGFQLQKLKMEGYDEDLERVDEEEEWHTLFGRNDNAFARRGLLVSGQLDLSPLTNELRALGVTEFSVMITTPQAKSFASFKEVTQCNPYLKYIYCSHMNLETASPSPITFSFGYRFVDLLWKCLPLAVFLLIPVGLTLWMRRSALRAGASDPSAIWFRYFRFLNLSISGTWLIWLPIYAWANLDEIFYYVSDKNLNDAFGSMTGRAPALPLGFEIIKLCLYLLPPALITILCHLLSHKVFTRLRGMEWSPREVVRQAVWAQASMLIPLFFFITGITSLKRNPSLTATCFIFAFVSWLVCTRLSAKAQSLTPSALTTGELRERIFALAARAGVALRQIYILPAGKGRTANAFARKDNAIILTDSLLQHLNQREIGAVVAHELAHLKEKHPRTLGIVFISTIVAANILVPSLAGAASLERWTPALFSFAIAAAMLITHFVSRGYERHADAIAITLTSDPEALITGLVKLARLNLMPVQIGSWDEKWSTHPSTMQRIQYLAAYSGIPPQRLQELLAAPETDAAANSESLPHVSEHEKIFSTSFKARNAFRISWTIIAVVTTTPVLLAFLMQRWQPTGSAKWIIYGSGIIVAFAFYQLARNFLALSGYRPLQKQLREKMERQGFMTNNANGTFVGFAPAPQTRIYEGYYIWDAGFLFLTDEKLCYVGEETRFALRRDQVIDVYLGDGLPNWIRGKNLYIKWRDEERGTDGTFYLSPGGAGSLLQVRRKVHALYGQIQSWLKQQSTFPVPIASLAGLSTPAHGTVTSQTPRAVFNSRAFFNGMFTLVMFTFALSVAFKLQRASILYAVATSVLINILDRVPRLLNREPTEGREDASKLRAYQPGELVETET